MSEIDWKLEAEWSAFIRRRAAQREREKAEKDAREAAKKAEKKP